jgi:hypothetical protein
MARPYQQLAQDLPSRLGFQSTPNLPYRPQNEAQTASTVITSLSLDGQPGTNPSKDDTIRKAVVIGRRLNEDTEWVLQKLPDWEHAIYVVDLMEADAISPTGLRTKMNKGREAYVYLTYIIEHYESFPDVAVFMHAHRTAWHTDAPNYDAAVMLRRLQLPYVQKRGYANLRCVGFPGCPDEVILNRNPPDEFRSAENAYAEVYAQFFNTTAQEVKEQIPVIGTQCCAQFAVSREQVWKRPRAEYERWRGLIETSALDDQTLGTVLEYMWHIIFGREAVDCESTDSCYINVYAQPGGWGPQPPLKKVSVACVTGKGPC